MQFTSTEGMSNDDPIHEYEIMRKTSVQLGNLHHPDNYDSISAKKRDLGTFQLHNI